MGARTAQGGNSKRFINLSLIVIVAFVVAVTSLGYVFGRFCTHWAPSEGRPPAWVLALLLASYALLIPGIQQVLFSFTISVELLGLSVTITMDPQGNPDSITESMYS